MAKTTEQYEKEILKRHDEIEGDVVILKEHSFRAEKDGHFEVCARFQARIISLLLEKNKLMPRELLIFNTLER